MADRAQQGSERADSPGNSEVSEKLLRRRFDAAYKQRILQEAGRPAADSISRFALHGRDPLADHGNQF